jgi:hypothetical protein
LSKSDWRSMTERTWGSERLTLYWAIWSDYGSGATALGRMSMSKKNAPSDVSIGKFDILAAYVCAQSLLQGMDEDEAKQRGMVAAIMGAQARLGVRKDHHEEFQTQKEAAEKKKKTTINAESFDNQVAHKMGRFFDEAFFPTMKTLVEAGLSYDEVKRLVKIPSTWGAKIKGGQFRERAYEVLLRIKKK